ncbi:MAG: polysaccharide biosynthesis/export family protein [Candidatus Pacebacteria bacterium]|nr:polysaccharide biosynthesis/export family protein [Candidatus Paceibacterota bacterium]
MPNKTSAEKGKEFVFGVLNNYRVWYSCLRRATSLLLASSAGVLIAGCSTVPGMLTSAEMKSVSASHSAPSVPVTVTEIDASVVNAQNSGAEERDRQAIATLAGVPGAYRIGPADVLQVTVWDHPELAHGSGAPLSTPPRPADPPEGVVVDEDGFIQFPYVGRLKVSGLSTGDIQARLREALTEYFRAPQVTVRVASFRARRVFIDGEVHSPGILQINDVPMTLTDAVGRAGGFTANADVGRLQLIRGGSKYVVDLGALIAYGESPERLVLRDGDTLHVMARDESGAYVLGEVVKPITAIPKQDGSLSLADALSQAGSFNASTSDPRQLYVVRGVKNGRAQVFHLDAHSPVAMIMAARFRLKPDDVVYVAPTDLAVASRVLNLLLPAIDAGLTGAVLTK